MPRHRLRRWVTGLPRSSYFKPQGIPLRDLSELRLPVEGLEALRLADMEGLTAEAAAAGMGVSRHTFGRVLAEARATVAQALVTGAALRIGGGHYEVAPGAGENEDHDLPESPPAGDEEVQMQEATMRQAGFSCQGRGGGGGGGGGGRGGGGRCGQGRGGQGRGQGGGPCGQGRGQGGGQAGGQTGGGQRAAMTGPDLCVCPRCGQTAPHTPGSPCTAMTCPACGAAMTRQSS